MAAENVDLEASSYTSSSPSNALFAIKVLVKLSCWYTFSTLSNIYAKKYLKRGGSPDVLAWFSLGIPSIYFLLLHAWFYLRRRGFHSLPLAEHDDQGLDVDSGNQDSSQNGLTLRIPVSLPILSVLHLLTVLSTFVSMSFSNVSFTYTIKASEPFSTAALSWYFSLEGVDKTILQSLGVILLGTSMACFSEPGIRLRGVLTALASNLTSSTRSLLFKNSLSSASGSSVDQYLRMSLLAFIGYSAVIPWTLFVEGREIGQAGVSPDSVDAGLAALFHFLYYSFSFLVLADLSALSHTVANVLKRVITIFSAAVFFGNPISPVNLLGIILVNAGVAMYSIAKRKLKSTAVPARLESSRQFRATALAVAAISAAVTLLSRY